MLRPPTAKALPCQKLKEQTEARGALSEGGEAHVPAQGKHILYGPGGVSAHKSRDD